MSPSTQHVYHNLNLRASVIIETYLPAQSIQLHPVNKKKPRVSMALNNCIVQRNGTPVTFSLKCPAFGIPSRFYCTQCSRKCSIFYNLDSSQHYSPPSAPTPCFPVDDWLEVQTTYVGWYLLLVSFHPPGRYSGHTLRAT